jgi:hypothetical protein
MVTERKGKVVKLSVFSGKREDYNDCARSFMTYAAVHKFTEALVPASSGYACYSGNTAEYR